MNPGMKMHVMTIPAMPPPLRPSLEPPELSRPPGEYGGGEDGEDGGDGDGDGDIGGAGAGGGDGAGGGGDGGGSSTVPELPEPEPMSPDPSSDARATTASAPISSGSRRIAALV